MTQALRVPRSCMASLRSVLSGLMRNSYSRGIEDWAVENANHHIRDRTFQKNSCLTRTGDGPNNRAMCNDIALALIFRCARFDSVPQAVRHFNLNRNEAFNALFSPT